MEELVNFLNVNEIKKKELADFLGISVQFLGQILRGERKLPYNKLKQIKAMIEIGELICSPMLTSSRPSATTPPTQASTATIPNL